MPTFGGGDDGFGVGVPGERSGLLVVVLDEAVDRRLEGDDRVEHTAFEPAASEFGEEALDRIAPRARGRREVEDPAGVTGEPLADVGVFVGGVVVEDHVDHLAGWDGALDGVEEADELLVAVALHALADHRALEHVEGGEQGGGTVALVVVGHRAEAAGRHRQARLGAVERLDLRFLVDREDHGVGGGST